MAVSNDFSSNTKVEATNVKDDGIGYSSAHEAAKSGGVNTTEKLDIKELSHEKHVQVILEETVEKTSQD